MRVIRTDHCSSQELTWFPVAAGLMVTGATAAGARHVPGHRCGQGADLRHPQRQDGQVPAEHWEHVNGCLPSWTISVCLANSLLWTNLAWQIEQVFGDLPSWTKALCRIKPCFDANFSSQNLQSICFLPSCTIAMCRFKIPLFLNSWPQTHFRLTFCSVGFFTSSSWEFLTVMLMKLSRICIIGLVFCS